MGKREGVVERVSYAEVLKRLSNCYAERGSLKRAAAALGWSYQRLYAKLRGIYPMTVPEFLAACEERGLHPCEIIPGGRVACEDDEKSLDIREIIREAVEKQVGAALREPPPPVPPAPLRSSPDRKKKLQPQAA